MMVAMDTGSPKKYNALDMQMIRDLHPVYDEWLSDSSEVKVIVMDGTPAKGGTKPVFCSGGDVAAVREEGLSGGSLPVDFFYEVCAVGTLSR